MDKVFDVCIIGSGPAGISAALTLSLHQKSIAWFGNPALSDKVQKSEKIANYAGSGMITGKELNDNFKAQIDEMGLEIQDKIVTKISVFDGQFMVLASNDVVTAKTVLLAPGSVPSKGINGETQLLGLGVSYCATCDGFLYRDKTIGVFLGNEKFQHEAEYLAALAKKVYVYSSNKNVDIKLPNVEMLTSPIKEVVGENKVEGIKLVDGKTIGLDGMFFLRPSVAPATLIDGLELDGPHIVVDRYQKTNIPGLFAAGDCTGRPYQIAKAVGEGNVAAHSIIEYL